MSVSPWWQALEIRPEIIDASGQIDDVQMSLGDAVYATGPRRPLYADADYFGQITHPTARMVDLLSGIAIRLGGGPAEYKNARALIRMGQGMGGGKSHAEIAAYHLGANPQAFLGTDIGRAVAVQVKEKLGHDLPANLNNPVVVVLDLDKATPGATKKEHDGPFARNLYERFLWRLFDGDANKFKDYREFWSDKDKIGEALESVDRPVLIIIDEIMDYVGNGLTGVNDPQLTAQDMGFLRALVDVVNDVPNVAMLVAMIDPEKDRISLAKDGKERQADLHSLLDRNGHTATVNEDTDFTAILRRRLFTNPPTPDLTHATADLYRPVMDDKGWAKTFDSLGASWVGQWASEVERSYPFHPQLMHLAEQEWAKHSGYQNVRATIRVFAATIYAWSSTAHSDGWAPWLIGPGDLPLWNSTVRESILGSGLISDSSLEQNYRSIMQGDITTLAEADVRGGQARLLDDKNTPPEPWGELNPRAHERAATMIAVTSLMPRGQGRRGASAAEIKVASSIPNLAYGVGDADGVLDRLTDINSDAAMAAVDKTSVKGQQPRFHINPETGPKVIYRQHRQAVTPQDRDDLIAITAQDIATTGPFKKKPFVDADRALATDEARRDIAVDTLLNAGVDDARTNRMIILDPSGFSLRNGMSEKTMEAVEAAMGLGAAAAPVEWASSAVFVVVNTQRRRAAREAASDYLAWRRTYESPELVGNDSGRSTAQDGMREADTHLKKNLKRAFQHILYLSQPTPESPRTVEEITLDEDALTALDGTVVWKELAAKQKVFLPGQFGSKALLHNLRDTDYDRPLAELRDAFYQTPRLPLLPNGEQDLRHAIFAAIQAGELRLVKADGPEVAVDSPDAINLSSQGFRLAKPAPVGACEVCGKPLSECGGQHDTVVCEVCGKADCDGHHPGMCLECGKPLTECAGHTPAKTTKSIKFTLAHDLTGSDRNGVQSVIGSLYSALMTDGSTFITGTVEIVTDSDSATRIEEAAETLGIQATTRDV
ncbi:MAG: DUF499 domain-containing protein [Candidatus Nanopelagicales bacterium]